jgi:hypothetical protein
MKKNHACCFDPISFFIKIQVQAHYSLAITKKRTIYQVCEFRSVRNFIFLRLFLYDKFELEILYIDRVGSKQHV